MINSNSFFFFTLILHIFIVIKNGKIDKSRNMGRIVVIFLELEISGVAVKRMHQNS